MALWATKREALASLPHSGTDVPRGLSPPSKRSSAERLTPGAGSDIVLDMRYRMKLAIRALLFVAGIAVGAGPALGHHSLSQQFDLMQSITLTGTVARVDWSNPHVRLYLDTNGSGGAEVMHWEVLMSSPNQLILHGIKFDKLRRGDRITVTAHPARDGSNWGFAQKISLAK